MRIPFFVAFLLSAGVAVGQVGAHGARQRAARGPVR